MDRPLDRPRSIRSLLGGARATSGPLHWALPTPNGLDYAVREGPWKLLLDQAMPLGRSITLRTIL